MTDQASGPGMALRLEREALGVTVREVADTLNLSMTVVQALEADDYSRLPGAVFARGYIRSYARLLDLDAAPLLAKFPRHADRFDVHPVVRDGGLAEWIRRRPKLVLSTIALVLITVLGSLALLLWPRDGLEALWRSVDSTQMSVPPVRFEERDLLGMDALAAGADPEPASTADAETEGAQTARTEADANGDADPDADADVDADVQAGADAGADAGDPSSAGADATGDVLRQDTAQRLTDIGNQRLRLDFSADSWVEIRSAEGRVLYSKTSRSGTELELVGQGPFRIVIGYAPAVTLSFEGEPVALAPHTRNNVATLVLEQ